MKATPLIIIILFLAPLTVAYTASSPLNPAHEHYCKDTVAECHNKCTENKTRVTILEEINYSCDAPYSCGSMKSLIHAAIGTFYKIINAIFGTNYETERWLKYSNLPDVPQFRESICRDTCGDFLITCECGEKEIFSKFLNSGCYSPCY